MSEYSNCIDNMYNKAEIEGLKCLDTAWLDLDGIWWPNPHYKGESVNHPEDSSGTQTNPPQPNPLDKYRNCAKYGDTK
jgi:hypothetical protein